MIRLTLQGFEIDDRDGVLLKKYIETAVGTELSNMSKDCYYPRVKRLFNELMYRTSTDEKMLKDHAKKVYPHYNFFRLHDPYTVLLLELIKYFLNVKNDEHGAVWTFNLFSIRTYSNTMFKYISKGCNQDYWKVAMETISHSHIFKIKQTVSNSVMYFSNQVYKKYRDALIKDDPEKIKDCIYYINSRINQSVKSFYRRYYSARVEQQRIKTQTDSDIKQDNSFEQNTIKFASRISKDICVYGKIDKEAINQSRHIIKFNKLLSEKYILVLKNPDLSNKLEVLIVLMLRDLTDTKQVCSVDFLKHVKRLMSIKTSSKPVYFKKNLVELHDNYVIPKLNLTSWFNSVSIQTKKMSRDYLAYYLAFFIRNYLC